MKLGPSIARLVVQAATKWGLEPAVVAGVVMQESSGDPRATRFEPGWSYFVRATDAVPCRREDVRGIPPISDEQELVYQATSWGLMQVLGSVCREQGARFADLSSIKLNASLGIQFGCAHLARLMRKHDLADALSAYNAGEGGIGSNPRYVMGATAWIQGFREQGVVPVGATASA